MGAYILDEPSIGLHQRDNQRLLDTLTRLRDLGNTVLVVEHDEDAIRQADYVVDLGPGAGVHGGEVVARGTPEEIAAATGSLTGEYLSGRRAIPVPTVRTPAQPGRMLRIVDATGNNLQSVTVDIPLGVMTCVTGVSGSGKSTLVVDTLFGTPQPRSRNRRRRGSRPGSRGTGADRPRDRHRSKPDRPDAALEPPPGPFRPIRELFAEVPESRRAATIQADSASTCGAAAARRARATASSASRCTSSPTRT